MQPQLLEVKRDRFDLLEDQVYLLQGNWPKEYEPEVFLDKTRLAVKKEPWESTSALERFSESEMLNGEKATLRITLPESLEGFRRLYVYACAGSQRKLWFETSAKALERKWKRPQFYLEEEIVDRKEGCIRLRG